VRARVPGIAPHRSASHRIAAHPTRGGDIHGHPSRGQSCLASRPEVTEEVLEVGEGIDVVMLAGSFLPVGHEPTAALRASVRHTNGTSLSENLYPFQVYAEAEGRCAKVRTTEQGFMNPKFPYFIAKFSFSHICMLFEARIKRGRNSFEIRALRLS
jgi:hypothetical protein